MQNIQNQNNVKLNTTQPKLLPSKPELKTKAIEKAFNIIAILEGLKLTSYKCPAGIWTIGYGTTFINNKPVTDNMTITKEQAQEYLCNHLNVLLNSIWQDIYNCNSNQIASVLSFIYNCGKGAWDKSGLKRAILTNPNNFQSISIEFRKWVNVNGKKSQGLVNRREAEIKLYCNNNT